MSSLNITAAVLAGGKSSRMGIDKALAVYRGSTLLARIAGECRMAGLPVIVAGRDRPEGWELEDVRFVRDITPGQGPLGGLIAALTDCGGPVLALACDMPLVDIAAIRWLIGVAEAAFDDGWDGAVATTGAECRLQPLFAVYSQTNLPALREAAAQGRNSLTRFIEGRRFHRAPAREEIAAKLVNVNTPIELEQLSGSQVTE